MIIDINFPKNFWVYFSEKSRIIHLKFWGLQQNVIFNSRVLTPGKTRRYYHNRIRVMKFNEIKN